MAADREPIPVRAPRRQMLPYYAYRAAETVVRVLPHDAAYGLGAALAGTAVTLRPGRFRALRGNLRRALPEADERTLRRVVRANVRNLARCWIDVMEMGLRSDDATGRVRPQDTENLLIPHRRGRGVVIVSLHLGSWDLGLATWNRHFGQMAVLVEVLRPRPLFDRIVTARSRLGVQVIPIDVAAMRGSDPDTARRLGATALRDVYRVLRAHGMVAMAMDRDLAGSGEPLPFFGSPVPIPVGVVEVAIRTGAAVVPIVMLRGRDGLVGRCFPEITYDAAAERGPEVRRVAAEALRVFEGVIREHPDQWHVLDPLWPSPAAVDGRPREAATAR
jgi:phosphatidylinositol dimannoside acyltransferase